MNDIFEFAEILKLDLLFSSLVKTLCYGNFFAFVGHAEVFPVLGHLKSAHQCIVSYTVSLMTHQCNFQKSI